MRNEITKTTLLRGDDVLTVLFSRTPKGGYRIHSITEGDGISIKLIYTAEEAARIRTSVRNTLKRYRY